MKKLIIMALFAALLAGCSSPAKQNQATPKPTDGIQEATNSKDGSFTLRDMETTVSKDVAYYLMEDEISSLYGKYLIKFPVHFKNLGKSENYYNTLSNKWYDPSGNQIQMYMTLEEDDVDKMGAMLKEAESDYYFYVPYISDGKYTLTVNNPEKTTLEFDIKLPSDLLPTTAPSAPAQTSSSKVASFEDFKQLIANSGITISEEMEMGASLVGAAEGYAYMTDKGKIEIYKFDISSDAFLKVKEKGVITLDGFGDIKVVFNDEGFVTIATSPQEVLDGFK